MNTIQNNINEAIGSFNAIKDKIIEKGVEVPEGTRTRELADKVTEVYDAGKQTEYDTFWDNYQENGNRTNCIGMFAGKGWDNETIIPKYNINPAYGVTYMFYRSGFTGNLKEHLENLNVTIDFSQCKQNYTGVFQYAELITETPPLDMSGMTSSTYIGQLYHSCSSLVSAAVTFSEKISEYNACFTNCKSLENLTVSGEIAGNGLDFKWSTNLSAKSLLNIVNALSSTFTGSITLPSTAEATYNANPPEGAPATWADLTNTKTNWTIVW